MMSWLFDMQKKIGLLHCVYSPLWVYIFVIAVYFACNIRNEQYSGFYITNTPTGTHSKFQSRHSLSIIAASIVSTTLGTVTMLDLIMHPPDSHLLNRHLLSLTLFVPIASLVVYGCNLETFLPITIVIVHLLQLVSSTAVVCDFLRKVCPSTFTDLLSGTYCTFFLTGCALAQIGFGSESVSIYLLLSVCIAIICAVLILYSVFKILHDKVTLSFLSERSSEKSIFYFTVGSYFMLVAVTCIDAGVHIMDTSQLGSVEIHTIYWSGVLFSYSILFAIHVFDGKERIANEKINAIKLTAEETAKNAK